MTSSTDASSISKDELILIFRTGPVIYEYGGTKVVRVSDTLVLKAGRGMTPGEAKTQEFAYEQGVRVPQVHRILKAPLPVGYEDSEEDCWLMLMDFIPGELLEQAWPSLTQEQRLGLTKTIAQLIRRLQSVTLNDLPPGPVGADDDDVYQGPYFTHYGAGPFSSVADMEAWYNHKLDVCINLNQLAADSPRFKMENLVLTHQDIVPRNIIIEEGTGELVLIDWAMGGLYPPGFEQAALARQGPGKWDVEFRELVLANLPEESLVLFGQMGKIMYALTTGAFL